MGGEVSGKPSAFEATRRCKKACDIDSGDESEFSFLDDLSAVIAATDASRHCAKLFASDHRASAAKASCFQAAEPDRENQSRNYDEPSAMACPVGNAESAA